MALRAAEMKERRPPVAEPCSARLATAEMLPTPAECSCQHGDRDTEEALTSNGPYRERGFTNTGQKAAVAVKSF